MTHVVYLVMMITFGTSVPHQMSTERSIETCTALITSFAATEKGNNRNTWYCQPAVVNSTLGVK